MKTSEISNFLESGSIPNDYWEETFRNDTIGIQDLVNEPERVINLIVTLKGKQVSSKRNPVNISDRLQLILNAQERLKTAKSTDIHFTEPIVRQTDNPIIYPNTINVIQGQAGANKSRFAEYFCSALLRLPNCNDELLGLVRTGSVQYNVVYVDTERNLSEQLPYSLQKIQMRAGFQKHEHPENFKYITLLPIPRRERFAALEEYLTYIRSHTDSPLFIVLDVSTDCIEDFNKTDKSMELIDLMNIAINEHNVIFLCLIHENPKSDKARGHFGTELMNKASTVLQVSYEKDSANNDTDLIRVKYLKCRSTARHPPFYFKYCDIIKGLVLASNSEVNSVLNNKRYKATCENMIGQIEECLRNGSTISRENLLEKLTTTFSISERTIEARISEIMDTCAEFRNNNDEVCELVKEKKDKKVYYRFKQSSSLCNTIQ